MKHPPPDRFPPRLPMDAYVAFVEELLLTRDVKQARRQKEFEERISKSFSLEPRPSGPSGLPEGAAESRRQADDGDTD